eukprot:7071192-Prymnesium_polylepis.1
MQRGWRRCVESQSNHEHAPCSKAVWMASHAVRTWADTEISLSAHSAAEVTSRGHLTSIPRGGVGGTDQPPASEHRAGERAPSSTVAAPSTPIAMWPIACVACHIGLVPRP